MQTKKLFDLRFSLLILFQASILVVCLLPKKDSSVGKEDETYRNVGNQLQTAGVLEEAVQFYEKHLDNNSNPKEKAQLLFRMGEMYEQLGQYEKALSRFTWAKNEKIDVKLEEEISKKMVGLLERLRKFSAAKRELIASTSLDKKEDEVNKGGVVIATMGNRKIYLHDVEKAMDQMGIKAEKQEKANFLQKYIADELMYEKAKRMDLEKDPKVNVDLEMIKKQLLVQKIMEKELGDIAKVDPTDVENYYKANTDKYNSAAYNMIDIIKVKDKNISTTIENELKAKKENFLHLRDKYSLEKESQKVMANKPYLDFSLNNVKTGDWLGPKLSQGHYYFIQVNEIHPAASKTFQEVAQQASVDYQREKAQKAYTNLVQEMLKSEKVEIHWDKLESK